MSPPIVTIAEIERRARAAFRTGLLPEDCPFNWHSSAYKTWHDEYERCKAEALSHHMKLNTKAGRAYLDHVPQSKLGEQA